MSETRAAGPSALAGRAPGDFEPTPGQTIGPFYGFALPYEKGNELVPIGSARSVRLTGTVYDGHGEPVPDAMLEIWQADEHGRISAEPGSLRRDGFSFTGFGREATDDAGRYTFSTVDPGPTEEGAAPFISVVVFARGLLNRLFTRIYLPEDAAALANDPLLRSLEPERRATLIGRREADGGLRFDIRLQGDGETVFLQFPRNAD
ncbi:protocatechuate 3,4-dioxygenase subunit alpha [Brevibacterium sp. 5221]|uniref:Protocatechuate 3,4-dioxygenase subunit alpha n=1 Tax=Brevibacterium rongguiense TaxID=2695267 RepID=A0A6N9H5P9_9MICO|nr:protocatechuate 3,4-dioxygenase subunit alpha [Brevibacterium rongguiense]MYM19253.1 protocatechuate 3,4-dioxygenase subunit alpha [Brevibacterium rongguiense]